jgi:antitoxin component of MazEF toxin-antitoxin module
MITRIQKRGNDLPLPEKPLSLKDLLSQVTELNIHHEIDTSPAVGNEVW